MCFSASAGVLAMFSSFFSLAGKNKRKERRRKEEEKEEEGSEGQTKRTSRVVEQLLDRHDTDAVFTYLKGVKRLNIGECFQLNLTDDSLKGIEWLNMDGHSQAQVEKAESFGYPVVTDG